MDAATTKAAGGAVAAVEGRPKTGLPGNRLEQRLRSYSARLKASVKQAKDVAAWLIFGGGEWRAWLPGGVAHIMSMSSRRKLVGGWGD